MDSGATLADNEVLVVGRVELTPSLTDTEQDLGDAYKEFRNVAMLITDDSLRPVEELRLGDLSRRIDATFDQTFFVRHPNQPFYILKGWVVMWAKIEPFMGKKAPVRPGNAGLPGAFRVDIRPGDKAVYIGTIRYYRDDFFGITKVVVKDDFARANAAFKLKFGQQYVLSKALATPIQSY